MSWRLRLTPAAVAVPLLATIYLALAPDVGYLVMFAAHFGPWPVALAILAVVAYRFFRRGGGRAFQRLGRRRRPPG